MVLRVLRTRYAQPTVSLLMVDKLAGEVQGILLGAADDAMAAMLATRAVMQSGFDLTAADALAMKCRYLDEEGDLCALNRLTLTDWTQQHPRGPLRIHVSLRSPDVECSRQSANVPSDAMHRDNVHVQNAVPECESPKFETGVKAEVKDRRVDQTRPQSPIPTADHVEKEAARCGVKTEVVDCIQTAPGSPAQAEGEHHRLQKRCPCHRKQRGAVRSCRCSPRQICTRPRIREP